MVFSSLLFIFRFLPITLIIYYLAPKKLKNLALFIASLVFYSWGEVRYFPVMVVLILVNYITAILIEKYRKNYLIRRTMLFIGIFVSLGMLFVFKYSDFLINNFNSLFGIDIPHINLTLPLGISFYTFQTMSYTIDVYRGKVKLQKNIISLGTYVVMFPQLIAGPIVRYSDVSKELESRTITLENLESGIEDFILGLGRKVLIANNVGQLWSEIEKIGVGTISTGLAWLGILAFSLQIYFDFSGYSQMAIGMGKMLGFNFPKNFDNPYQSRSVTEFWRRWHMTLSSWFREYLYFPLGGSRLGNRRTIINLFIVWSLTGLWHGASWNFVFWGIYFFVLLVIEKSGFINFLNKHRIISYIYMFIVILVGWALFSITDFSLLGEFLKRMFIPTMLNSTGFTVDIVYYLRNYAVILAIGFILTTPLTTFAYTKLSEKKALKSIFLLLILFLSVAYLVDSTFNPFLYFRF
ncbi:MAG: MBOAT family protein [Ruminococcaceae bacterium]|nr:MBOAT family protein [Oscillospiraceae bacterium]